MSHYPLRFSLPFLALLALFGGVAVFPLRAAFGTATPTPLPEIGSPTPPPCKDIAFVVVPAGIRANLRATPRAAPDVAIRQVLSDANGPLRAAAPLGGWTRLCAPPGWVSSELLSAPTPYTPLPPTPTRLSEAQTAIALTTQARPSNTPTPTPAPGTLVPGPRTIKVNGTEIACPCLLDLGTWHIVIDR